MDLEKLQYFRNRLIALREEERDVAAGIGEGLRTSFRDATDELSLYDNHPADVGDITFERAKDLGLKLFAEDRLAMINEALLAIEKGTFGMCGSCGQPISIARLEAVPYTTFCQDCQKDQEDDGRYPRPIEEEVISSPYGGLNPHSALLHRKEDNAFDGEDSWQAVARYGSSDSPSDTGEDMGIVEDYEGIAAVRGKDGQLYQDFGGKDDEDPPENWLNE